MTNAGEPTIAKPLPSITPEMKPFFEGTRKHELRLQQCSGCGTFRFPPRKTCSVCLSNDAEWERVSGYGEVYSFAVMHQVYHPAFAAEAPYAVVVIRLDEGAKLTSNLVGVAADEVEIGMRVEVNFERRSDEVTLPVFKRAE